ncbi:MAG: hypothetical protein M5R40_24200 [Anaerolineae bacterium]|nr:hypothetical protein [Anaerolineae bacterium]
MHYSPDTAFAAWFDYLEAQASEANLGCHPAGVFEGTTRSVPVEQPPAAQPASWDCRGNLYDCSDFAGRCDDLCAYQRACPGDPSHMDGDGDGWM